MMAPNSASVEGQSTSVSVSLESLQLSMDEEHKSYMEDFKVIIILLFMNGVHIVFDK
jgi:hypothetical protein